MIQETPLIIIPELDEYLVSSDELVKGSSLFVPPIIYEQCSETIKTKSGLCIVGEPGIGKRMLASQLAYNMNITQKHIYLIPNPDLDNLVSLFYDFESLQTSLIGLDHFIKENITNILIKQNFLSNDEYLRSFFVDERINYLQYQLQETSSVSLRATSLINFLIQHTNSDGENALISFLKVLRDSLPENDGDQAIIVNVLDDLELQIIQKEPTPPNTDFNHIILILPNVFGSINLIEDDLPKNLENILKLQEKVHLIMTTPDFVYEEIHEGFELGKITNITKLEATHYSLQSKAQILDKHILVASENNRLSRQKRIWLNKLIKKDSMGKYDLHDELYDSLQKWIPQHIYQFVFASLQNVERFGHIFDALQQVISTESRIREWFLKLSNSTKCFIFSLSFTTGQSNTFIWSFYILVAKHLQILDPTISILPLGIMRYETRPFVTEDGIVDFINPRIHQFILKIVTIDYREYFLECETLFANIFSLQSTIEQNKTIDTNYLQLTFAQFLGEINKTSLVDTEMMMLNWAITNDKTLQVMVSRSLEQTATSYQGMLSVYELLEKWSRLEYINDDVSLSNEEKENLRWTVGSICWRLVQEKVPKIQINRTVRILKQLSYYGHKSASSVAYAVVMLARYISLKHLKNLLTFLAKRRDIPLKYIAWSLDNFIKWQNEKELAIELVQNWSNSQNIVRRLTSIQVMLFANEFTIEERKQVLLPILVERSPNKDNLFAQLIADIEGKEDIELFTEKFGEFLLEIETSNLSIHLERVFNIALRLESNKGRNIKTFTSWSMLMTWLESKNNLLSKIAFQSFMGSVSARREQVTIFKQMEQDDKMAFYTFFTSLILNSYTRVRAWILIGMCQ